MTPNTDIEYWLRELRGLYSRGNIFSKEPSSPGATVPLTTEAAYAVEMIGVELQRESPFLFDEKDSGLPGIFIMIEDPVFIATPSPKSTTRQRLEFLYRYFDQDLVAAPVKDVSVA